jgi:hypothetical protein
MESSDAPLTVIVCFRDVYGHADRAYLAFFLQTLGMVAR